MGTHKTVRRVWWLVWIVVTKLQIYKAMSTFKTGGNSYRKYKHLVVFCWLDFIATSVSLLVREVSSVSEEEVVLDFVCALFKRNKSVHLTVCSEQVVGEYRLLAFEFPHSQCAPEMSVPLGFQCWNLMFFQITDSLLWCDLNVYSFFSPSFFGQETKGYQFLTCFFDFFWERQI